jgi:hypothetical protein
VIVTREAYKVAQHKLGEAVHFEPQRHTDLTGEACEAFGRRRAESQRELVNRLGEAVRFGVGEELASGRIILGRVVGFGIP